jgi:translation initiation factor 2 beta subunit (eIF-2beta)/eIF-5
LCNSNRLDFSSSVSDSKKKGHWVACSQCGEKKIWVIGDIDDYDIQCLDCIKEHGKKLISQI